MIIYNDKLIPELLQQNYTAINLIKETKRFFDDLTYRKSLFEGYETIKQKLGSPGASIKAAKLILEIN